MKSLKYVTAGLNRFLILSRKTLYVVGFCLLSSSALADSTTVQPGAPFKLVELFTSHGCSSCPSADTLLGTLLAEDASLMALEYHVDYWNTLVHGSAGSFTDPFSDYEYSMRQRHYREASLRGRPGVYTPQAIVNGRQALVGSNKRHLLKALGSENLQQLGISITSSENKLQIELTGNSDQLQQLAGAPVKLVRFLDKATTQITGGENKDLQLVNHHIVYEKTTLGVVGVADKLSFAVAAPAADEGCVVLVQGDPVSPVYAAAECP